MPTQSAEQALKLLRDGSQFQWYVIPIFVFVVYVYSVEIEKKNWSAVFAGLAFWGMDWFNEIWNSLVFHFTKYAPAWGAPGKSAYLILIGLNIEISFMFAIAGIVFVKSLPPDKSLKILGIPNRWFFAVLWSIFCVFIEVLLNSVNALTWDYFWWNTRAPWLIFLIGYLHFFVVAFLVYDMKTIKNKIIAVATIYTVVIVEIIVFGFIYKMI
ncbi:MAG: hypothetical protein HQK79_20460 [Desulfobacterales bacterium]|nr:hypothetical protein [Desulfobacterales bacterium]